MELFYFAVIIFAVVGGFWFIVHEIQKKNAKPEENQSLLLIQNQIQDQQKHIQQQMNELTRTLDARLGDSTKTMLAHSSESANIIKEITRELVEVKQGQKQVVNITDELKSLKDILKNPKQRGVLGEYYLETTLKNVFSPTDYQTQYPFKDGTVVDAVIFVGNQIVPVDSKFSLENYNRLINENDLHEKERLEKQFITDLKNRIDETSKYIKPNENTVGIAFMFIPSEAIYYDLLINRVGSNKSHTRDLIDYAYNEKHVVIVSPTTLAAYFQVLSQAMRAFRIQESTEKITGEIEKLTIHLARYDELMAKLGKNLGTTVSSYNIASKEFSKIDKDIYKITGEKFSQEVLTLERPEETEE